MVTAKRHGSRREVERSDVPAVRWRPGWHRRRGASLALAGVIQLAPVALSLVVTLALAPALVVGTGWPGRVASFLVLTLVALVVAEATLRSLRSLGPLAFLLRLSLAFPGEAPSRFAVALRASNSRLLERPQAFIGRPPDEVAIEILGLVSRLGDHDRATRGHSERVRAYTELLADELGLADDERNRLRWAGLIHDVGKLHTPRQILAKRGSLDEDEWEIIRRHPDDGLALALPLWPWMGRDVLAVADHHERWEGGGYPTGVAGEEISLAGRVVAVADAFDVMTSSRSYKRPISTADATAELVRCSGTQFDPAVVRAFVGIPVRRLRRVIGPFPALIALFTGHLASAEGTFVRNLAAAALLAGLAVGPLGPAPDEPESALPIREAGSDAPADALVVDPAEAPAPDSATGIDSDGAAGPGDPAPTSRPGGNGSRPNDAETVAVPPPRSGGGRPAEPDGPPDPEGPDDPGPPDDRVTLVVDPEEGSVGFDGIGPPDGVDVVEAPAAGDLSCGRAGLCEPIEVPVPAL